MSRFLFNFMPEITTTNLEKDPLLAKLIAEKEAGIKYQSRRHTQWRDNYALYRDIVETNELTQRQAINVPMMKETKKTILSRIDDPPDVSFDCLEKGNKSREKETNMNEIWNDDNDKCNFETIDILEKNNVLLEGRTFKVLNFLNGKFSVDVPSNLDIVVDPKMKPWDIETAKYIVRLHIQRSLREILADPKYTQEGKNALKAHLQATRGLIQFKDTEDENKKANEDILRDLGIDNFDELQVADIEIELNEHWTYIWDTKAKKFVRYVVVVGADSSILYKETLKKTLGVEFWPAITWADDLDNKDVWSDGVADIVRVPNQIANIFYSSWAENMVLQSLGMYWYLPAPGYDPQTFEPRAFGQYPAPLIQDGHGGYLTVEQVIKKMDIPALAQNPANMEFLVKIVERATAATAIEKGVREKGQITLGEVEKLTEKASERIISMAKFYRRAWREFAWKWQAIRAANAKEPIELYRKSKEGNYFKRKVYSKDWISTEGYKVKVVSSAEQESKQLEDLQKVVMIQKQMPLNKAFQKIARKRMMGILNLTPQEEKEIEEEEEKREEIPSGEGVPPTEAPIST
jgi:hypothetical protein